MTNFGESEVVHKAGTSILLLRIQKSFYERMLGSSKLRSEFVLRPVDQHELMWLVLNIKTVGSTYGTTAKISIFNGAATACVLRILVFLGTATMSAGLCSLTKSRWGGNFVLSQFRDSELCLFCIFHFLYFQLMGALSIGTPAYFNPLESGGMPHWSVALVMSPSSFQHVSTVS